MLSLENAQKLPEATPNQKVQQLFSQLTNMSPAKQTAVNQAAHLALNSGQFQPIYYYTANPNASTGVQLGYPGVLAGAYSPYFGAAPNQFYNHPVAAYSQFMAPGQNLTANSTGLLGAAPGTRGTTFKKKGSKTGTKMQIYNSNSSNSESSGSIDNGVHSIHTKSSLSSRSEHGDDLVTGPKSFNQDRDIDSAHIPSNDNEAHTSNDQKEMTDAPKMIEMEKSELVQIAVVAPKVKKTKPPKPVKKVIVVDLPEELQTIDTVTNKLSVHGEILSVRVIKPGKIMPFDLKMYSGKIHDLGTTVCAIVEFDSPAGASASVENEEATLKLALLKQGAEIALYGKTTAETPSVHSSEHTQGESGIGCNINRNVSNRDSLSNHSHDDLDHPNNFEQEVKKVKAGLLPTPSEFSELASCNMTEVDFNNNNAQVQAVQKDKKEEKSSSTSTDNQSQVISTSNGRITTALTIILASGSPKPIPRSAIKLDLTSRRHPKINLCVNQLLPDPVNVGRISPGLLSDPSDELLVESRFSEENLDDARKYSRDYLFSLRECKRALQLPDGLPNIPELLPTSKQVVIVQTNSNAGPHKANHHNQGHGTHYNKGHHNNQYKYNNNTHHNSHFNKPSYGKQ